MMSLNSTSLNSTHPTRIAPALAKEAITSPESGGPTVRRARPPRGVRVIDARNDGACVVEVRAPRADNPLSRAYRALAAIGVRLVHTEVRVAPDALVQRLHLLEPDDSPLSPRRLVMALAALAAACHVTVSLPLS
jgi:hypothetical protein